MKNNKGVFQLFAIIISMGLIVAMGLFGFLFIKNMITQELLPEAETATLGIIEDYGNNTVLRNVITSQRTNINNLDFKLDLIFLAVWVATTMFILAIAYYLPPLSKMELGSFLFIGILLLLFWLNFIEQVFSWYVVEFITNIFTPSETALPMFNWYMENYIFVVTLTMIGVVLINQFSRKPEEDFDLVEESFKQNDQIENDSFNNNEIQLNERGEVIR